MAPPQKVCDPHPLLGKDGKIPTHSLILSLKIQPAPRKKGRLLTGLRTVNCLLSTVFKRLVQVCDEVFSVLYANAETDERIDEATL